MNDRDRGLYGKFFVERTDGKSAPGQKHDGCEYYVLDLDHDKHAAVALEAYADSCAAEYPVLAADLRAKALTVRETHGLGPRSEKEPSDDIIKRRLAARDEEIALLKAALATRTSPADVAAAWAAIRENIMNCESGGKVHHSLVYKVDDYIKGRT